MWSVVAVGCGGVWCGVWWGMVWGGVWCGVGWWWGVVWWGGLGLGQEKQETHGSDAQLKLVLFHVVLGIGEDFRID